MFENEREERQKYYNSLYSPDENARRIMAAVNEAYPAFAAKILSADRYVRLFVLSGMNSLDFLELPVCGSCERIALWDHTLYGKDGETTPTCRCMNEGCGKVTKNPITMEAWIGMELKRRVAPQFWDVLYATRNAVAAAMLGSVLSGEIIEEELPENPTSSIILSGV